MYGFVPYSIGNQVLLISDSAFWLSPLVVPYHCPSIVLIFRKILDLYAVGAPF